MISRQKMAAVWIGGRRGDETRNDFFGRCGKPKTARKIISRAERKNA